MKKLKWKVKECGGGYLKWSEKEIKNKEKQEKQKTKLNRMHEFSAGVRKTFVSLMSSPHP